MAKPMEAIYQAVSGRIRMIREAVGMDQGELGRRVGLNRTSITNIEAGRQRFLLHDLEKFATALGTTPKHLLKGVWW